jgi:putative flippase GtrA
LKFNIVGAMGFLLQLAVLHFLATMRGVNYLVATGIAVQAAVLHNFFWHERFTWADRVESGVRRVARLLLFDAMVGTISMAGNVLVMGALIG